MDEVDYKFGEEHENSTHQVLNDFFVCDFEKTDKYATFDFTDEKEMVHIELKTRRNTKHQYPTTMMPYSKVRKGLVCVSKGYRVYFVFKFIDQLCYYELLEQNTNYIQKNRCGRKDRGKREYNDYYMIPITVLQNLTSCPDCI